jgi:WD40 repeat protein
MNKQHSSNSTSNVLSVDEIIKNMQSEDYDLDSQNIKVDDIINEYGSHSQDTHSDSRFGFNPSIEERKPSSSQNFQDEELRKIMEMADDVYSKHELKMDGDMSKYIESLNLNLNLNDFNSEENFSPKKNSDEILPYKNSIDFVNYMETIFIKSKLEGNENVFQLKNYKQHAKIKFIVLDFIKKSTLSQRFYRGANLITSIAAQDDVIFAGNNLGVIRMYSCEKEYEYKSYTLKELETSENKRSVVCMDISQDGDFLISGYSNGFLALWDLHTTKCKKLINNVHKSCIVAVKFIRNDKKKFEILSSDIEGNVFKIIIKDGMFSTSVDSQYLIKHDIPLFLINVLKIEEEEKKLFPELNKLQPLIVAFGCLDYIMVFMLEPESKRLFKFEKPKYFKDVFVPDISFGVGYVPNTSDPEFMSESIMEITGNQSFIQGQMNIDYSKPQILLSISWGKIIYIYCLPINNGAIHGFTSVGHYINSSPIIRMGFLSTSIIFFFDKQKFVKVINSSLITPGEVRLNTESESPIQYIDSNKKPELEEGRIVDPDICFQTYVVDKVEGINKATYNNFIINLPKNIFVLGKKDFYHGKLLNWEQCLNNLHQNAEWMDALTLGLDIYHGRTTALADIPIDEYVRKTKVGHVLRNLIHQYAIIHTGNDRGNMLANDKTFQDRLNKCINICIEFCLEIDAVDFLLTSLQPIFDTKGYGDEFIQKLEPFILCDKIINQQLQQMTISKIIDIYIKNKKFHVLSQILIHLDIQSIDIEYVKYICNQYNLITPLIYVYSNGNDEDYFYPVKKIYEVFQNAKEIKHFVSYAESASTLSTNELENSKQYTGHKLLWYINMCLSGKKFPGVTSITEMKLKKLIVKIILWILSDEVFTTLLNFDSNSTFIILVKFFQDEKLKNILNTVEFDSYDTPSNNPKLPDLKLKTITDLIVAKCVELNKSNILQDMYEFIAKISTIKNIEINKHLIIEAAKFLLSFNSNKNSEKENQNLNLNNNLSSKSSVANFNKFIENMSNTLIEMIDARNDLDKNDIFTLLSASELSPFVMVKIHLLKLSKSYKRCLEVFLTVDSHINNKQDKVFEWIDETFKELNEEDPINFDSLKEEVLNKLHILADLSIDNVTKLVENWFEHEQDEVIHKLDKVSNLQLKYVENVIEKFKDEDNERKLEQYLNLLKLHIKLLCKINPSQVLANLKRRSSYPVDECLKKCLKYKVYDAAIHLYQSTGAVRDALTLALDVLNANFSNIMLNLASSGFKDNTNTILLEDLRANLRQCVEICENNSDKVESPDGEEMWFLILEQLYGMLTKIRESSSANETRKTYYEELNKRISQDIKDILEKMCSYVSIQKIITNVTEKYKQAEFKEFKKLLLKMLSSYSHLKNILISAKNLLANSILYNVIELKKLNHRGNRYNLYKCDQCSRLFNHMSDEAILVFGCGHKCHMKCVGNDDSDVICNICRRNEIENSVTNPNIRSLIQSRVRNFFM